jgi:RND superfamily putative drug exporter
MSRAKGSADQQTRGRRTTLRWIVPAVLVVLWVLFNGVAGGYAERLGEVVKNDNAAFLPAGAESTKVAGWEQRFVGSEQLPAVVLYQRQDGAVTDADRSAVAGDIQAFGEVDGVVADPIGPIPSEDGTALQVIVPVTATGDATVLPRAVEQFRERAGTHPGLRANVTGPAGFQADFSDVFAGIDVALLLVALGVVFVILVGVYRSIILPIAVLLTAVFAQTLAAVAVYQLASHDVIKLNGQSQGTLIIICIGAATDYALLLAGRFREELTRHRSRFDAIRVAVRRTTTTILASGLTVIIAMMCLLLADLSSNRGYGPVFALGVSAAMIATLTFLAALLALLGRAAFWPVRPRYGAGHARGERLWGRLSGIIGTRPRRTWLATGVILLALAAFIPSFRTASVPVGDQFLRTPDSVIGLDALGTHFPAGSGAPALIVARADAEASLTGVAQGVDGVADVASYSNTGSGSATEIDGHIMLQATLADPPDSGAARDTIARLRASVHRSEPTALVGGNTAVAVDTAAAGWTDLKTILPIVLVVVLLLLIVVLRAIVAPLLLAATVVLSVAATIGTAAVIFNHLAGIPGADPSLPLFCVVFLIALGVDYNIFLMARAREESSRLGDTRAGVLRALTATGGVITSAGVVLAATFSVLGIVPFLPLVQIAIIIATGILIDTFLVRALLVPALSHDVGARIWWPSRLSTKKPAADPDATTADPAPPTGTGQATPGVENQPSMP